MMFELRPYRNNNKVNYYDPFREMEALERAFFGRPFDSFGNAFRTGALAEFKTDIKDLGNAYLLEADLPGFDKKDIRLDLNGDTLTISAERHTESENDEKKDKYLRVERSYGSYSRSYDLTGVDVAGIKAKYENGVLAVNLPKLVENEPKPIQIEIE